MLLTAKEPPEKITIPIRGSRKKRVARTIPAVPKLKMRLGTTHRRPR